MLFSVAVFQRRVVHLICQHPMLVVAVLFFIALIVRLLYLQDSTYFGIDEARDAFVSQGIYLDKHLIVLGPTVGTTALHHGVLFWYILGPLYLLAHGDPLVVSVVFRILNCLGLVVMFYIGKLLFNTATGLVSAAIYAFSYEETQYSLYTGNPSLAVLSWLLLFLGIALIYRKRHPLWGLLLTAVGASTAVQFELYCLYAVPVALILLVITRRGLSSLRPIHYAAAAVLFLLVVSSFWISELKYHFRDTLEALRLLRSGYHVLEPGDNRFTNYAKYLMLLFRDNIMSFAVGSSPAYLLTFGTIAILGARAFLSRSVPVLITVIWILAGSFMLLLGGYNQYYMNVGLGLGVILGVSALLVDLSKENLLLAVALVAAVLISDLLLDIQQNQFALNVGIKAQPGMRLSDEQTIIDRMYRYAAGRQFTFRVTSMPYKVQTTWAYLLKQYGSPKWGYLPLLETGNVPGYEGSLPVPTHGTTCVRFYIREPMRGIPFWLADNDVTSENYFSNIVKQDNVGQFLLQYRQAFGNDCNNGGPATRSN
jgi:hypothetical protein